MEVKFVLKGVTPCLMHADDVMAADALTEWRKDPKNKNLSVKGDDRSPPWTWTTYLYSDGTHVTVPSDNLLVCLRVAGAGINLKGNKSFKSLTQSGLLIREEYLRFTNSGKQLPLEKIAALADKDFKTQYDAVQKLGFRLDVRRARVGDQKHIRVRPRFDKWELSGTLKVLSPEWTAPKLKQLFELAESVGMLDWRPGSPKSPGKWGMFTAQLS